jgi:HSP20 family protein
MKPGPHTAMRYRHLSYRYAIVVHSPQAWPFGDIGKSDRLRLLGPARWRPDADMYETATKVEVVVDLAGVAEDDFEIQLFEDALIIEGHRQLPTCEEGAVYHAAGIHQGPFRIELPLPALVNPEHVEPRYERGLLRITLPKRAETG